MSNTTQKPKTKIEYMQLEDNSYWYRLGASGAWVRMSPDEGSFAFVVLESAFGFCQALERRSADADATGTPH